MKYICLYAQEFPEFRLQELQSIAELYSIHVDIQLDHYKPEKPYLCICVKNEAEVLQILSRSVLLKSVSELWSDGDSISEAGDRKFNLQERIQHVFSSENRTFKFHITSFTHKISALDRVNFIEGIQQNIKIPADVDMKNPDVTLTLSLDFSELLLTHVYFGKLVGTSQRTAIHKYNLKTRYFIGNTSMDPQLAMLMANQALTKPGAVCYDPFVGTGSILVACGHFGALCGGSDIDYTIIFGRGKSSRAGNRNFREKDELVRTNFDCYSLSSQYWDVIAADATRFPFRSSEIFDAVVTDPPYGIREGGRKVGSKKADTWTIPEEIRAEHIPAKTKHGLAETIAGLLEFASKFLVVGGRLVYWLPVYKPTYCDETIPKHPGFQLVANSEQSLTKMVSRRLITMRKIKSWKQLQDEPVKLESDCWLREQNEFRKNFFLSNCEKLSQMTASGSDPI